MDGAGQMYMTIAELQAQDAARRAGVFLPSMCPQAECTKQWCVLRHDLDMFLLLSVQCWFVAVRNTLHIYDCYGGIVKLPVQSGNIWKCFYAKCLGRCDAVERILCPDWSYQACEVVSCNEELAATAAR